MLLHCISREIVFGCPSICRSVCPNICHIPMNTISQECFLLLLFLKILLFIFFFFVPSYQQKRYVFRLSVVCGCTSMPWDFDESKVAVTAHHSHICERDLSGTLTWNWFKFGKKYSPGPSTHWRHILSVLMNTIFQKCLKGTLKLWHKYWLGTEIKLIRFLLLKVNITLTY